MGAVVGPDDADDAERAWASDDIPVPQAPTDVTWMRAGVQEVPEFETLRTGTPDGVPPARPGNRPKWILAAIGAVAVLIAVAVSVSGGDDEPAGESAPITVGDTTPTDDTIAEVNTTVPATTVDISGPAPLGPEQLELPPAVASITAPTEVLAMTSNGVLHTLSLPSGRVRSVAVADGDGQGVGSPGIVVAPDAAAVALGRGMMIVPREGEPLTVGGDRFGSNPVDVIGWHTAADGSTEFRVARYGNEPVPDLYDVSTSGAVEFVDRSQAVDSGRFYSQLSSGDGFVYLNDAGGVYRIGPDGAAERIETGMLLGANDSYRLVRDCSAALECGYVVVDQRSGERRPVSPDVLSAGFESSTFSIDLAPDGSAINSLQSSPNPERVLVDLTTGASISTDSISWAGSSRWAADSSGVFEIAGFSGGIDFLDRASGEVVHFADELGELVTVGTRAPDTELAPEADVVRSTISLGEDLSSPTGLIVAAVGRSGGAASIDVDAREVVTWGSLGLPAGSRPTALPIEGGLAVIRDARGYLTRPGGERELPDDLFGEGPVIAGPIRATAWTATTADRRVLRLVDLDAGAAVEPAATIVLPDRAELLGGDGRGGVLFRQVGDVYLATADGTQRLTTGELLAIGADVAFVRECDDRSECSVLRVDRATGQRVIDESSPFLWNALDVTESGGLLGTSVAPGGRAVLLRVPVTGDEPAASDGSAGPSEEWMFVDLGNASATLVDIRGGDQPIVWSPDGNFAAVLVSPALVIYDRSAARMIPVDGTGPIRSISAADVAHA